MNGEIGSYIYAAGLGAATAQTHLAEVFCRDFQTPPGWSRMLSHLPAKSVVRVMNLRGAWWTRGTFQALYVACWIHHPVEKGTYMIQLPLDGYANVKDAYRQLLASGGLQARGSSHLSKQGASANEGWEFLKGYEELLLQIEGETNSAPYLFLKCEGHSMSTALGTVLHGASFVMKKITGSGATASAALKEWASFSSGVEGRAAENFSNEYQKLLKQLGLKGKNVTVAEAVEALHSKAGFTTGIPDNLKRNTTALGAAMAGPLGYIALFKRQKTVLKKAGVDFNDTVEGELKGLAERMSATTTSHEAQHYNEVRVTPVDLDASLANFRRYIP